jgi:hypothetical protein
LREEVVERRAYFGIGTVSLLDFCAAAEGPGQTLPDENERPEMPYEEEPGPWIPQLNLHGEILEHRVWPEEGPGPEPSMERLTLRMVESESPGIREAAPLDARGAGRPYRP